MNHIGQSQTSIPSYLTPIKGGDRDFSRGKVKKEVYKILDNAQKNQSTNDNKDADFTPLTIAQQKEAQKELIKAMKIKAKEYYEKKDFGKAYALYHHVRTLNNADTLCKIRINEIKGMKIELTKKDAVIALSGFFMK